MKKPTVEAAIYSIDGKLLQITLLGSLSEGHQTFEQPIDLSGGMYILYVQSKLQERGSAFAVH